MLSLTTACYVLGGLAAASIVISLAAASSDAARDRGDQARTAWSDREGRRRLLVAGGAQLVLTAAVSAVVATLAIGAGQSSVVNAAWAFDQWLQDMFPNKTGQAVSVIFGVAFIGVFALKSLRRRMIDSSTWNVGPRSPLGTPLWWRVVDRIPTIAQGVAITLLLVAGTPVALSIAAVLSIAELITRFGHLAILQGSASRADTIGGIVAVTSVPVFVYSLYAAIDRGSLVAFDAVAMSAMLLVLGVMAAAMTDRGSAKVLNSRMERTAERVRDYLGRRRSQASRS